MIDRVRMNSHSFQRDIEILWFKSKNVSVLLKIRPIMMPRERIIAFHIFIRKGDLWRVGFGVLGLFGGLKLGVDDLTYN